MSTRFKDRTDRVIDEIGERRKRALTAAAIQLEGEIAIRTPVDTGHLRASISHIAPLGRSRKGGDRLSGKIPEGMAVVGTNTEYAAYVEYGTRYQKAQPYMRTGYAAAKPDIDRIITEGFRIDG